MASLAPKGDDIIQEKLEYWTAQLREYDKGLSNMTVSRKEITGNLDHWLDVKWALEHPEAAA